MKQNCSIQIIAGLGNVGQIYAHTRHNIGFMFVDQLADIHQSNWQLDAYYQAKISKITLNNRSIWLIKPQNFMNHSGYSIVPFMRFHRLVCENLLVIHDELDLMPGEIRVKQGGGNGGHNGLKNIQAQLGSANFWRVRLGIGHPRRLNILQSVADFVLSRPNKIDHDAITNAQNIGIKYLPNLVQTENFDANTIKILHTLKAT